MSICSRWEIECSVENSTARGYFDASHLKVVEKRVNTYTQPDRQGGLDLWQFGKIINVALSAALKPTAARDLEPRSMQCLRRTFPKKI